MCVFSAPQQVQKRAAAAACRSFAREQGPSRRLVRRVEDAPLEPGAFEPPLDDDKGLVSGADDGAADAEQARARAREGRGKEWVRAARESETAQFSSRPRIAIKPDLTDRPRPERFPSVPADNVAQVSRTNRRSRLDDGQSADSARERCALVVPLSHLSAGLRPRAFLVNTKRSRWSRAKMHAGASAAREGSQAKATPRPSPSTAGNLQAWLRAEGHRSR